MKKDLTMIKKLTLGMVAVATLGLGSCVDDGVSDEMKAIYKNQATLIANKAALKKAEADVKAAEVAVKTAQAATAAAQAEAAKLANAKQKSLDAVTIAGEQAKVDAAVAEAQAKLEAQKTALEKAKADHANELLKIAAETKKNNFTEEVKEADQLAEVAGKYNTKVTQMQTVETAISGLEANIARLKAAKTVEDKKAANVAAVLGHKQGIEADKATIVKLEEKLAVLQGIYKGESNAKTKPGIEVLKLAKVKEEAEQAQTGYVAKRKQIEEAFNNLTYRSSATSEYYTAVAAATANVSAKEVAYENAKVTHTTKKKELADIKERLTDDLNSTADKTLASALTDQTNATNAFNEAATNWNPSTDTAVLAAKKSDMDAKKAAWEADPTSVVKKKAYEDAKAEYDALKAKKDKYDAKLEAKNTADSVVLAVKARNTKVDEILEAETEEDKAKKDVTDAEADKTTVEGDAYKNLFASIKAEADKIKTANNDILYYTTIDMLAANYAGADSDARTKELVKQIDLTNKAIQTTKNSITTHEGSIKELEANTTSEEAKAKLEIAKLEAQLKAKKEELESLKVLAAKYKKLMEKYLA